jgi:SAM-dependent methyltransferase
VATLDTRLLTIIACPVCRGMLTFERDELRCASCAHVFPIQDTIPLLLEKPPITDGFDYLTHYERDSEAFDYFEERSGATAHSERRLREYIFSLVPKSVTSILDVGCGSAWVAQRFQNTGAFVCSLDISSVNPRKALERYPFSGHVGVAADSYHLPFKDGSFDAIIAAEIIEHLHNPQAFADELMRVIKPGGVVVVSTPFRERLVYEMCIHCHQPTPHNAHLHSWDERSLTQHFSSATTTFHTFNNKLLLFARTYPALQYLPFRLWRSVDSVANKLYKKPVNCIVRAVKGM